MVDDLVVDVEDVHGMACLSRMKQSRIAEREKPRSADLGTAASFARYEQPCQDDGSDALSWDQQDAGVKPTRDLVGFTG